MASSSLAAQLSKTTSVNASLYVDRTRRKPGESYLFSGPEADQQDFQSLHALGVNALATLKVLEHKLEKYENSIFSDASRGLDRTLQSESQNAELDQVLNTFLGDIAPYILEAPTSKALEWIVRRFRVHEFNVNAVMASFLPYHDTPHFTKMLSILHINDSHLWSFLEPVKKAVKPLPRSILVNQMISNVDLARFVLELLPNAVEAKQVYRTLVGFVGVIAIEYVSQMKRISPGIAAFLVPAMSRLFSSESTHDAALTGCIVLAAASGRASWSSGTLTYLTFRMVKGQKSIKGQSILPFLVAILAAQNQLREYSDPITNTILALPGCPDALTDTLKYAGSEKLVLALLPSLARRHDNEACHNALVAILSSTLTPDIVIEQALVAILKSAIKESSNPSLNRLLSLVFQRHGEIFSEVTSRTIQMAETEDNREILEKLVRSLSLPSTATDDFGKLILHAASADISSRASAIRELLPLLSKDDITSDNRLEIHEALKARLSDTSVQVIEAIYSRPQVVISAFSDMSFVTAVSHSLQSPEIPRAAIRLHLAFIAEHLYPRMPDLAPAIFEKVYFPFLLFSKPRQKTAVYVWQSLEDSEFQKYELFAGCLDIIAANKPADGQSRSVEEMAQLNLTLATCIAGNIVQSNGFSRHVEMLMRLLREIDGHTLDLCYLVVRSLLNQLSGEHQVDVARIVLSTMNLYSLNSFRDAFKNSTLQEIISDENLGKVVTIKPNNSNTLHRLQIAILALLPIIPPPVGININWLEESQQVSSDTRGDHFSELARAIYSLANTSSIALSLSTNLTKALFVTLREQALLFLAGIWSKSLLSDMGSILLPQAALFHAAAFLKAQLTDICQPQDFQTILPALLLALSAQEPVVRTAASDCIAIIAQSTSSPAASSIYALYSMYGSNNDNLQYLEWQDLGRFSMSLNACRQHFINDVNYLGIFAQENLSKTRTDSKKDAAYKEHVLCYLLSHIVAWDSIPVRVLLLSGLRHVSNRVKLQLLLPLIQGITSDRLNLSFIQESAQGELYLELLIEAYDKGVSPDLADSDNSSWSTLIQLIRRIFTEATPSSSRKALLRQLADGIFESVGLDNRREICTTLIEVAGTSTTSHSIIKNAFSPFLKTGSLIASLIAHFVPEVADKTQRAPKRPKLATDIDDTADSPLHLLTILLEILVAHPMPGSVELMASALDALSCVCHAHSSHAEANYVMQLLLSVLESVASSLDDTTVLVSSSIRMEILVEILRIFDNSQTFNQALLLIANLARVAPEFVMQNIMPIFTFMGSNVFHRDDSYSFRVVQKTVDSLVPVVIASLKRKHSGDLELQKASREVLRIFTDASTHVPKHRRTHFFNYLVECLGKDNFVVPVCLLLVDKAAHRVVRQKPADQANTFNLPLAIIKSNFASAPFKIVEQFLQEAMRLTERVLNPEDENRDSFLEWSSENDVAGAKKQIQAILLFVDFVLQQSVRKKGVTDESNIRECVHLLLHMSNLHETGTAVGNSIEISRIAIKALGNLLRVVSVAEFISAVVTLLKSKNLTVENGAMNLLASRLVNVTTKTRQEISSIVIIIIDDLCTKLQSPQDTPSFRAILNSLHAIGQTAESNEVPALSRTLPLVLKSAKDHSDATVDVMQTVLSLSLKMGPRILPIFKDIVRFCGDILQDGSQNADRSKAEEHAHAVLLGLLSSVSQFWGVEDLARLGKLSLNSRSPSIALRKALPKKISAKQMLPALPSIWADLLQDQTTPWDVKEAFFDLLKRVIRSAPRVDVHENLKELFKLFLEAFDQCSLSRRVDAEAFETLVSAAFVDTTTKLNEATFKPLFHRLFDWAFNTSKQSDTVVDRQVTFSRTMTVLITLLKGLITPYMGTVLEPAIDLLNTYKSDMDRSSILWLSIVNLFENSITNDEGAFWREEKLQKLSIALIKQIQNCPHLDQEAVTRSTLKRALVAVVTATDDDTSLKKLNLDILMQTRSEDALVRLFSIECADNIWQNQGDKLTGFVTDVVTFIAECADDEHDEVAKAARKFKRTVEQRCGSLDMLMQ